MKIYEIDQAIEDLINNSVDPETGEVELDLMELEDLQMERERKIENLALYIKNAKAEALAIKNEEEALAKRRKALCGAADRAEKYLEFVLHGERFTSPRVAVSYRTSSSVELDDQFIKWAQNNGDAYLRYKDPEPDKAMISRDLKAGLSIPHARITQNSTITIK